jgi:hypothetical protein
LPTAGDLLKATNHQSAKADSFFDKEAWRAKGAHPTLPTPPRLPPTPFLLRIQHKKV